MDNTTAAYQLPLQINKKHLCNLLHDTQRARLVMPSGKCRYDKLKALFVQANLLDTLKMIDMDYDNVSTFTIAETQEIYKAFDLRKI